MDGGETRRPLPRSGSRAHSGILVSLRREQAVPDPGCLSEAHNGLPMARAFLPSVDRQDRLLQARDSACGARRPPEARAPLFCNGPLCQDGLAVEKARHDAPDALRRSPVWPCPSPAARRGRGCPATTCNTSTRCDTPIGRETVLAAPSQRVTAPRVGLKPGIAALTWPSGPLAKVSCFLDWAACHRHVVASQAQALPSLP